MFLYNVTFKIEPTIQKQWLEWIQLIYVPTMMNTGLFLDYKFCKLMGQEEQDGMTYTIQASSADLVKLDEFRNQYEPMLRHKHFLQFKNQFVSFRTVLEVI